MSEPILQVQSIILPQVWVLGTETEDIDDLVTHPSIDVVEVEHLQEKQVHILATEVVTAGVPGNLLCWIELSPVPSTTSTAFWAAIGGGGGPLDPATGLPYIPPTVPLVEVATGVDGTLHTILLPWEIHSPCARLVVQTPVSANIATATWTVQARFSAKGP